MSENSRIEWCHHSFNPVHGCSKISPGCDHCYAERDSHRFAGGRVLWGVNAERREFGDAHWNAPLKWDKKSATAGVRSRVFCASMADVFDKNWPEGTRERLWGLIKATQNLQWLLLTKRVGNAESMLPPDWGEGYRNVWLGISVVNQIEADRDVPKLLNVPAAIRWLSMEPLLGPVDVSRWLRPNGVNWVVAGGESGPQARPKNPMWSRSLRDQCATARIPFLLKQHGEWAPTEREGDELAIRGECDFTNTPLFHEFDDGVIVARIGKKAAGRRLDGVTHDAYPEVA